MVMTKDPNFDGDDGDDLGGGGDEDDDGRHMGAAKDHNFYLGEHCDHDGHGDYQSLNQITQL